MTRKEAFLKITAAASPLYGEREAAAIAYLTLETLRGISRLDIALGPCVDVVWDDALQKAADEIASGRPVQYVLGRAVFSGFDFAVDERVLVPRPETEELVGWITDENRAGKPAILDIGTGSGAIAVALAAMMPGCVVHAIDISAGALEVASRNAAANNVEIYFEEADVLSDMPDGIWLERRYDIIVSNPPYIPRSDMPGMHRNVTGFEPHGALFVADDDPLVFYRAAACRARDLLNDGGSLYFEIYEKHGDGVAGLLKGLGFKDVVVREDINGKQRMVRCRK